jgi:uncharacterized protein
MVKVYMQKFSGKNKDLGEVQKITKNLLDKIISEQKIKLEKEIPLKVHFGEKGNVSYVKSENYEGIVEFLKNKKIKTSYIETSVMYGGQRHNKKLHLKTAKEHGFTQIPIIIADGENGEAFYEIEVNQKNLKRCKLGKEFENYKQIIVLSHFKGHFLAGFGGAIKQLAMGFASKGGKLEMHMGIKPKIVSRKCKKCKLCCERCNEKAITINSKKSVIDHERCVGCGACVSICPYKAISIFSFKGILHAIGIGSNFKEKLVEYALAGHKNRRNIYVNFIMNVTKGCDCEPRKMKPIIKDIGILVSTDPVAIDQACYDLVAEKGKKFRGEKQLKYAEKIGLGTRDYELIEI